VLLDRLGRSLVDLAELMELAAKQGWALVVLDIGERACCSRIRQLPATGSRLTM